MSTAYGGTGINKVESGKVWVRVFTERSREYRKEQRQCALQAQIYPYGDREE